MSKALRYVMSIGIMGGSLFGGWVLMNTITPDPEELLKVICLHEMKLS